MVHEAALPRTKHHAHHGMRAAKSRREEMLKHAGASTAAKDNVKA